MLSFYHNSQVKKYREPFGAVPQGTAVTVYIDIYDDKLESPEKILSARLSVHQHVAVCGKSAKIDASVPLELVGGCGIEVDTENGRRIKYVYKAVIETPLTGVYFYTFDFTSEASDHGLVFVSYGNNDMCLGGEGKAYYGQTDNRFQITVYEADLSVPSWFTNGVIYQIFPDRFYRAQDALSRFKPNTFAYGSWYDMPMYIRERETNDIARWDFFGGNLMGVTQKLPYIEALGASVIYLNPIFEAASNHRYDTSDYKHVDSLLGGDASFDLLIAAGHAQGIRFILDGVFSHTGSDSIYFDKEGKYGNGAYKNPSSPFRSWYRFGENDDVYESWWGIKVMPNVEELDPSYLDYIVRSDDSVIKRWIRRGADGWRLDVADELPDDFIKALRTAADEAGEENQKETIVLGEVWEDASNKISYDKLRTYFTSKELHSVTNYPFRNNLLAYFSGRENADTIAKRFYSLKENYPKHNLYALVNMTGTHDVERLMSLMLNITGGNREKARKLVKAYAAVMFTYVGIPLVYYGDETCLEGASDPDNRRTYPWGKTDNNMIEHFCRLGELRKNNDVLKGGDVQFKNAGEILAFERNLNDSFGIDIETFNGCKRIVCAVAPANIAENRITVRIEDLDLGNSDIKVLATGGEYDPDLCAVCTPLVESRGGATVIRNFTGYIVIGVN